MCSFSVLGVGWEGPVGSSLQTVPKDVMKFPFALTYACTTLDHLGTQFADLFPVVFGVQAM